MTTKGGTFVSRNGNSGHTHEHSICTTTIIPATTSQHSVYRTVLHTVEGCEIMQPSSSSLPPPVQR